MSNMEYRSSSKKAIKDFPTPVLAIKQAICLTCWKGSPELKKCTACKHVSYCSQKCQKEDWNSGHKKICKVLIASNKRRIKTLPTGRTWALHREEKWADVLQFRKENPEFEDNTQRLLDYEPFCCHCYRSAPQLQDGEKLKLCSNCNMDAFCTTCPQIHPLSKCEILQEVRGDEQFLIQHYLKTQKNFATIPTDDPRKEYLPLSSAAGWYDYYTKISDKGMMAGLISQDMKKPLTMEQNTESLLGLLRAGSETGAMPLTIIAALEAIFPDISTKTSLNLHFIGAALRELSAMMIFEEILHLLPVLQSLKLTFVGFDMPSDVEGLGKGKTTQLECCPDCKTNQRTRSASFWQGPYHEYVKTDIYDEPHLAIAFHAGFSREMEKEWMPTLQYISDASHPTLFTCYNETEMNKETAIWAKLGATSLQQGELNKWRGLCPILEVTGKKESSVYYLHQYWYIIAGSKQ